MPVRVVVSAHAMVDLTAWVAALDLDRRVAYGEPVAQPLLESAHDMLCIAKLAIAHHHVAAERHLI